jgi:uncharacterized protein (TIGR00369 family)
VFSVTDTTTDPTMSDYSTLLESDLRFVKDRYAPGGDLMPNCFRFMDGEFLDYHAREMLKVRFPVKGEMLNPVMRMQGGFITAAFDNVFGPLSYVAARALCSTVDIQTHFLRGIEAGDFLTIQGRVVSRGTTIMHLTAEAFNGKGKLVATSTANMIIHRDDPPT